MPSLYQEEVTTPKIEEGRGEGSDAGELQASHCQVPGGTCCQTQGWLARPDASLALPCRCTGWLLNGLRPRNVMLTLGRTGGKRHLNCKQDSCSVCFPLVVMGSSPHLLLWCGLKAANAVGWERTPLFSLLQRAENNANYAQAHFIITNKDAGVLLRSWDLCRKKQGVHRCWGAMKEKADIGPVSFIGEEKNNILGLNIIYVGVVVIIRLVFPVGCFSARCNGTFLQHACVYMMCVWWSSLAFSDVRKLHLTGEA